jgi:hypothetical protein
MKITKNMLKKLIQEELGALYEDDIGLTSPDEISRIDDRPMTISSRTGAEGDPDMSTGWKLDRIIEILEKAFPGL